jgi:solute carrier family 25 carnitine/acylcarnitine transporter 20/29
MDLYKEIIKSYVGGYISGVSAILVSHPIDTIKTNYQEKLPIKLNIKSLYRGIYAPMIGIGLEKAVVFGTYDTMYDKFNSHILAGGISGLAASFIVSPYERLKILSQTSSKNNAKKFELKLSYLFRGLSATFYREVPGFAIYFSIYNYLKDITKRIKKREIKTYEALLYGGLSGATSWIFIYPQDRVKTHIQSSRKKISFKKGIQDILKDGGMRGLYRGFHFALLRAIPLHAIAFMVNEKCKVYL